MHTTPIGTLLESIAHLLVDQVRVSRGEIPLCSTSPTDRLRVCSLKMVFLRRARFLVVARRIIPFSLLPTRKKNQLVPKRICNIFFQSIGAQEDLQYFLPTIEVCRKASNGANASSFPLVAAKMSKLRRLSWRGNHNASFHNCVATIFAGGSNGMMASRQGDWHSIAESSSI